MPQLNHRNPLRHLGRTNSKSAESSSSQGDSKPSTLPFLDQELKASQLLSLGSWLGLR